MSEINILIYEGKGGTRVELKSGEELETMWATQEQIASILIVLSVMFPNT